MRRPREQREGYVYVGEPGGVQPDLSEVVNMRTRAKSGEQAIAYLARGGVPRRFWTEALKPKIEFLPTKECEAWVKSWRSGGSMILCGPPGTGKTTTAIWCLVIVYLSSELWWYADDRRFFWRAPPFRYVKGRDLYRAVFAKEWERLKALEEVRILVLDDWGAAYEHAWPLTEAGYLIDRRWEENRPTILTTNLHPEEGPESLKGSSPRVFSRLCQPPGPGVVILDRDDLRRRRGPS